MRSSLPSTWLALGLASLTFAAAPPPSAVTAAAWDSVLRHGDFAPLSGLLAEDVELMPPFSPTMVGIPNVRAYFGHLTETFVVQDYTRTVVEHLDLESRRVEHGTFQLTLVERGSGAPHELSGKYQDTWAPSLAGWRLSRLAWNFDHWPPLADQLRVQSAAGRILSYEPHVPVDSDLSLEIHALAKLHEDAVREHDADLWARLYAEDAVLLANHGPLATGRPAILAYFEQHVLELPIFEKLDLRTHRLEDLGGHVIETACHIAIWRNGPASGVNTGKDIRIWRRSPAGPLKLFRHISMYD